MKLGRALRQSIAALCGAATVAVTLSALGCSSPLSAKSLSRTHGDPDGEATTNTKVNVVLVHGAWADGTSWSQVITLLQQRGFHVTAVQIPLTSLQADVDWTRHVLSLQNGPTILVGHSYGGEVITAAGTAPNVVGLVYVAAFAPDVGEQLGALNNKFPIPAGQKQIQGPDDAGYLWINQDGFREAFAQDVDVPTAAVMAVVQKPLPAQVFGSQVDAAAWHSKPSWFLVALEDRIISPELERWEAQRMNAHTVLVRSSHAMMVSRPADVARVIEDAAGQVVVARTGS